MIKASIGLRCISSVLLQVHRKAVGSRPVYTRSLYIEQLSILVQCRETFPRDVLMHAALVNSARRMVRSLITRHGHVPQVFLLMYLAFQLGSCRACPREDVSCTGTRVSWASVTLVVISPSCLQRRGVR